MPILVTWTESLQNRRETPSTNGPLTSTHVPWWTDTSAIWDVMLRKTQESQFSFVSPSLCSLHLSTLLVLSPHRTLMWPLFYSLSFTSPRRAFFLGSTTSSGTKLNSQSPATALVKYNKGKKNSSLLEPFLEHSLKVPELQKWWRNTL